MFQDFGQTIEVIAKGALTILGQVGRTFRDTLFRPRRFADGLGASEAKPSQYIGPYTFLVIAGFLGAKAIVVTATASLMPVRAYLAYDTLRDPPAVRETFASLPTLQEVLLVGAPLVLVIFIMGCLFRILVSRRTTSAPLYALFYTSGIQYLLLSIWTVAGYGLRESGSPPNGAILAFVEGSWSAAILVGLPAVLLFQITTRAVPPQMRRTGRGFFWLTGLAAIVAHYCTLVPPLLGAHAYALQGMADAQKLAVIKVAFAGKERIDGDSIEVNVIATNQTSERLFLLSDSATVATANGTQWKGRLSDSTEEFGVVALEKGASVALKFQGTRGIKGGLHNGTLGRIEVTQVKPNGVEIEITSHVWPPSP